MPHCAENEERVNEVETRIFYIKWIQFWWPELSSPLINYQLKLLAISCEEQFVWLSGY